MIDLNSKVKQAEFAGLVGVSQPAVSDMLARRVLRDGGTAQEWLHDYCSHIREQAAGRVGSGDGDLDLVTERAGLAKAQREKIEMQNAVTRNELAPVYLIEEVLAKAGSRAAKILDTIPSVIKRREPSLSADTVRTIHADIAKVRNIAAAISLDDLRDEDADNEPDADSYADVEDV